MARRSRCEEHCFKGQDGGGGDPIHVSVAESQYVERTPVFASPLKELIKTETTLLLHMWIVQIGI